MAKRPGMAPHDAVSEAARKTLRHYFSRMLRHEAGAINGTDPEELHDIRVAVRRLRATVQLFRPYLPKKQAAYLRKDLRRLGRALGPARDCDVMLANLAAYRAELPAPARQSLEPLARQWQKQRKRARTAMLEYLASKRYYLLKEQLAAIVGPLVAPAGAAGRQNGRPSPHEPLVAGETPRLLTKRYKKLLAYGPSLHWASIEHLHALRIDCKRLRYALEFLRETLPPQADDAIADLTQAQDHLGELNDAYVAAKALRKLLKKWQGEKGELRPPPAAREAVGGYLAFCESQVESRVDAFPAIWDRLTGQEFRQRLQEIVASSAIPQATPPSTKPEEEQP